MKKIGFEDSLVGFHALYQVSDITPILIYNEEYFYKKGVWTNWYDFIGLDTSQFIQSKQHWILFCKKYKVSSITDYKNLCDIYLELPKNPSEFYTHFTNIHNELGIYKIRR